MSRRVALAAFGAAGVATLIGAAPAQAHPQQQVEQHTVAWATPADPTGPMPTRWEDAGHPQRLLSANGSVPDCLPKATWAQIDQYTVPAQDAADYAAFIAGGVLGEVNGSPADSRWVQSWRFVLVPRCVEATPTVTPSETPTTDAPVPSDTPTSDTPPADTPAEEPVTEAAAAPVSTDAPAAPAAPVVMVPVADEQLANTGTSMGPLALTSGGMVAAGFALLFLGRRRKSHR